MFDAAVERHTLLAKRPATPATIAALVAGALLACPIVALRYPPMGDLPFHESLVSLLRHFGDPSREPPGIYALSLGSANQLFHLIAAALSLVLPTDTACKVVVAASLAAVPVSAARAARHFGTSQWSALLVAPLALGFAFRWGLVGNVIALPILLASLPVLDGFAAAPTARRAAGALAAMLVLYLAHESALLVAMAASAVFAIRRDGAGRQVARLAPIGFGAVLATYYTWRSHHLKAPSILAVPDAMGAGPVGRLADVPGVLFGSQEPWLVYGTFGLYLVALAVFAVESARAEREKAPEGVAAWIERRRVVLVAAVSAVAFLVAPVSFSGSTVLYQRFLGMALAVGVVAIAPPEATPLRPIGPVLAACATLAALFSTLPAFGDADRRFRELDNVLPLIGMNSGVAQLDLTPEPGGAVAHIPGAGARALAERGGRLLFSFTDAPTSPVVVPADHQWNEPVLRLARDPLAFSPPHDFRRFRYALVRLAPEWSRLAPLIVKVMAPEGKFAGDSGEWILFESTLETVPLTAPDDPLSTPPAPTLRSRLDVFSTKRPAADAR